MIKKNDPLEIIETKYLKMKNQKFQNYRLKLEYKIKKSFYNVFKKITLKKI
jgi:hypothetical protein